MIVYRTFRVHASRFLPNLPDNHICKSMHGHTFNITVSVSGNIKTEEGFIMDFFEIDKIFNKHIHSKIDHKILNDVSDLNNPTSEYLAIWIWNNLLEHIPSLYRIKVSEDHGTGIIYEGDEKNCNN